MAFVLIDVWDTMNEKRILKGRDRLRKGKRNERLVICDATVRYKYSPKSEHIQGHNDVGNPACLPSSSSSDSPTSSDEEGKGANVRSAWGFSPNDIESIGSTVNCFARSTIPPLPLKNSQEKQENAAPSDSARSSDGSSISLSSPPDSAKSSGRKEDVAIPHSEVAIETAETKSDPIPCVPKKAGSSAPALVKSTGRGNSLEQLEYLAAKQCKKAQQGTTEVKSNPIPRDNKSSNPTKKKKRVAFAELPKQQLKKGEETQSAPNLGTKPPLTRTMKGQQHLDWLGGKSKDVNTFFNNKVSLTEQSVERNSEAVQQELRERLEKNPITVPQK